VWQSDRSADQIMTPAPFVAESGFDTLFDGLNRGDWRDVADPQSARS
jgi:hypothetical protein